MLAAATVPLFVRKLAAQTPDKIKIGLIGCGGRGTGAAMDAVLSTPNVEISALADVLPDQLDASLQRLRSPQKERQRKEAGQYGNLTLDWDRFDAVKVTPERCFTGFDGYKQLLNTDVDIVILATPPGFRPLHIRAAVDAGKHVFAEKPAAVDPVGARSVFESVELARKKNLGFMGGTQLRFHPAYRDIIRRIHDGQIGEVVGGECFWWSDFTVNWHVFKRQPEWSDMEYQIRCWPHFVWLSGDHIVENLVHNIDVMNWVMGGPPKLAIGMGGHANWDDWIVKGNVFDHFYIEYEYPNGAKVHASSRHTKNTTFRLGERVVGTKGVADPFCKIEGPNAYKVSGTTDNPRLIQWPSFIESIRKGKPLNTGKEVAESTLTAILGRMSAYTGRAINYEWVLKNSKLDLFPKKLGFGPLPVEPLAVPGRTPLV
jgi:predicted dehydrogenase